MWTPRERRLRRNLISSAIVLSVVLIAAAVLQREFAARLPDNTVQTRSRVAEPSSEPVTAHRSRKSMQDGREIPESIRSFMEEWETTLVARDMERHVACYAPVVRKFFRKRNVSLRAVAQEKRRMIQRWPEIVLYDISDLRLESINSSGATVTFRKEWDMRAGRKRFAGAEKQRLTLARGGDRWEITGEEELKIYRLFRR